MAKGIWAAAGCVCAIRRSRYGLHLVLRCPYVLLYGRRFDDLHFAPCLCVDANLADRLEKTLQEGDITALSGTIKRCTRPLHPIVAHDWDLIITRARPAPSATIGDGSGVDCKQA